MVNGILAHRGTIGRRAVERDLLRIGRWPCCKHCKANLALYPFCERGRRRGIAEISRRRACALLSCNLASALNRSHSEPPVDEAALAATRSKDRTSASCATHAVSFDASRCCGNTRGLADCGRQCSARLRFSESPSTSRIFRNPASAVCPQDARIMRPCHLGGTAGPVRKMREVRMGRTSLHLVPRARIERATPHFSGACSTD